MSEHEELENSVAAWVLGAAEPEDAEALRIHAQACPNCRETATRLRRAVNAIGLAVDEVEPPARLRGRILAAAAASSRRPQGSVRATTPIPLPRRDRRAVIGWIPTLPQVPVFAAAAAVVIALLLGVAAGSLRPSTTVAPASVARYTMTGKEGLAGARATVINLKGDGVALVDFSGLPALAKGKVYEVWLITSQNRADPVTVFVPDGDGSKVVVVNRPLADYRVIAITTEAGPDGSKIPSQAPQMTGTLQ